MGIGEAYEFEKTGRFDPEPKLEGIMGHTKGPWFVDRNHNGVIMGVASESRKHDLHFVCAFSPPVIEDDARLIASAPDLLEACKAIMAWSKDPLEPGLPGRLEYYLDAAITKATAQREWE